MIKVRSTKSRLQAPHPVSESEVGAAKSEEPKVSQSESSSPEADSNADAAKSRKAAAMDRFFQFIDDRKSKWRNPAVHVKTLIKEKPWHVAAVLGFLLVYNQPGDVQSRISELDNRIHELRSAIDGVNSNISSLPKPAEIQLSRPLNFGETAPIAKLTAREQYNRQMDQLESKLQELYNEGRYAQHTNLNRELRRLQKLVQDINPEHDAQYQSLLASLKPIYLAAMRDDISRIQQEISNLPYGFPYIAGAGDYARNKMLKPGNLYYLNGNFGALEFIEELSMSDPIDSYAVTGSSIYIVSDQKLQVMARFEGKRYYMWCPGQGQIHIAWNASGSRLMVRRDKLYTYDQSKGAWSVIDNPQLPCQPFAFLDSELSLVTLGEVSNGRVGYLHKYNTDGQLTATIKLSQPIETGSVKHLTAADQYLLVEPDLPKKGILPKLCYAIDFSSGKVVGSSAPQLQKIMELNRAGKSPTNLIIR